MRLTPDQLRELVELLAGLSDRQTDDLTEVERNLLEGLRPPLVPQQRRPPDEIRLPDGDLTPRESEVLSMVAGGMTNVAVAHALGISSRTVAKHLEHAYRKLDVHGRVDAVAAVRSRMAVLKP